MTVEERIKDYKDWTVNIKGNEKTTSPHYVLSLSFENEKHYYDVFKTHCQKNFGIKETLFEIDNPEDFTKIKDSIESMEEYKPFIKKNNSHRIDGGFFQSGMGSYLEYLEYKVFNHQCFVFPCNLKQYDCISCFKNLNTVDWKQNVSKCRIGDIVYIYLTNPQKRIQFKTVIEETNIPYKSIGKDDFKYYTDSKYYSNGENKKYVRLRLLESYGDKDLNLDLLRSFGLKNNIQGQGQLSYKIERKIEEYLKPNHPRGEFFSWEVLSDSVVIKNTDMSFFTYNTSGVPKEIQWFFNSEGLNYPERKNINLTYKGKTYDGQITTEPVMNRTRIIWDMFVIT